MIVLRVEHPYPLTSCHSGMYGPDSPWRDDIGHEVYHGPFHPIPEDDVTLGPKWKRHFKFNGLVSIATTLFGNAPQDFVFGFMNDTQFRRWLHEPKWIDDLKRAGFVVRQYIVKPHNVLEGDTQCAFLKGKAKLWRTVPWEELE